MSWLRDINPFRRKSLAEEISEMMAETQIILHQTRYVIESHQFLEHMAEAKISALKAWHERNVI